MTDPSRTPDPLLVIAHPAADLYGSDRQLLETIDGVIDARWRVIVVVPEHGPLIELMEDRGAQVLVERFPVLRKAHLTPVGVGRLTIQSLVAIVRLSRLMRARGAAAVYVNTMTIPVWLAAARVVRLPALAHVHEAEEDHPRIVRTLLALPLRLADEVLVNSDASRRVLTDVDRRLDHRISVVHNGVDGPPVAPSPPRIRTAADPAMLVLVGRLSPRKGVDVALEAVATLRGEGRDVRLTICGSVFPGYEWYEEELRARAARSDLDGSVTFLGYVNPTWSVLESADVVLVPSRFEPFGNVAVEGLLARRPVVASAVQGLPEVIDADRTGVLVEPGDPEALARGVVRLLDDREFASAVVEAGAADATTRFSPGLYREQVLAALRRLGAHDPHAA